MLTLWPHGLSMKFSSPECGVGSLSLLQGIFPTQGLKQGLPHCRWILYQLSRKGSPRILGRVADLPDPGIKPGSPALQVDSLPTQLSGKPKSIHIFLGKVLTRAYTNATMTEIKMKNIPFTQEIFLMPLPNQFISKKTTFLIIWLSVQFSRTVVSDSLWPHEPQYTRPPCPSPTPGVHSDSRPSSQWCHPAISSSVIPFFSCP